MIKNDLYSFLTEQMRIADYNKSVCEEPSKYFIFEGEKVAYEMLLSKLQTTISLKDFVKNGIDLSQISSNLIICRGIAVASGFVISYLKGKIPEKLYLKYGLY